ncbi:hypothetical protein [Synechocystis sp. CACIAM 05]|uniref:hypothetical protein n=1 Tax=Synechocystis sp. CACIAM 05 TaxID=1933929 RepID=UPI001391B1F4|nr:hypothetical protein [Synechocystis sp. CACIAM 05]
MNCREFESHPKFSLFTQGCPQGSGPSEILGSGDHLAIADVSIPLNLPIGAAN